MDPSKEFEKQFKELKDNYKFVFNSEEGKKVLDDLSKRCHESSTTFIKDNSHETAYLEGQRSIYLFIKAMIKSK